MRREDLSGITLAFRADGSISVSGTNRWGRPLDATYASEDYFRNALPAISQSVTPEQSAALDAFVERMHP